LRIVSYLLADLILPSATMPMSKVHRVALTRSDRRQLLEFIGRGEASAQAQTRARVLLKADDGPVMGRAWSNSQIAEALELSAGGVAGIRRRYAERGTRSTVQRKASDREYKTKLDGEQEARLIQRACSEAPEGPSQWSLRLLAEQMDALDIVDTISHETVRQTLQTDSSKTDSSRIATSSV
jgi:transposase